MRTLAPAVLFLLLACNAPANEAPASRAGGFRYIARSATGAPLISGRIDLSFPDDSTVTGQWNFAWEPGADTTLQVGPQVGTGELIGRQMGDTLLLQLNPEMADNNVGLTAIRGAGGYTGEWTWSAFTGPRSSGSFTVTPE